MHIVNKRLFAINISQFLTYAKKDNPIWNYKIEGVALFNFYTFSQRENIHHLERTPINYYFTTPLFYFKLYFYLDT